MTPDGLTTCPSCYGPKETMDRVAAVVAAQGMTIFARIDHAAAAANVGMVMRPTEVIIFGNPRAGTSLMQAAQTVGIDLPLKALVWQDGESRTWLSYNDLPWIAGRHGVESAGLRQTIELMAKGLESVARSASTDRGGEAP